MIQEIQRSLTNIYDLPQSEDVRRFLIDASTHAALTRRSPEAPSIQEEFLVLPSSTEEDSVGIGLFLRDDVLENLRRHHPEDGLDGRNWSDFCAAVEGVSHFVFFEHRARYNLNLSALELELQAEIDKFVTSFIYRYHEAGRSDCRGEVLDALFDGHRFREDLADDERERYRLASAAAYRFCRFLCKRYLKKPDWHGLFNYLRRFYRLGWNSKYTAIVAQGY